MGREVRRVPPNWDHPRQEGRYSGDLQPMFNERFDNKFAEWLTHFDRLRRGELDDVERKHYPLGLADWLQDEGQPPDPKYYRPWKDEEATWFQVWETVTEGTPITPPFATPEELVDYLVANGDFWDQHRGTGGWDRKNALSFVSKGWAPSMVLVQSPGGNKIFEARDGSPTEL